MSMGAALRDATFAATSFTAIGTTNRVVATDAHVLIEAVSIAKAHLADLDAAASRFRPDSEVVRLAERASGGPVTGVLSALLADYLEAALRAARLTDGLVDPTVGAALVASGYDADMEVVRQRGATPLRPAAAVPGWQSINLDPATGRVEVPQGCLIDLGATAKGYAADRIAADLAHRLPGGFLVSLGGDIATRGSTPDGGWQVEVAGPNGAVLQVVTGTGQAFATSSTRLRTWPGADGPRHHIVDPRTGRTASAVWAQVTCAAASGLEANAASTAAIILGDQAPEWLAGHGIPARLDRADGVVVLTPGWPDPEAGGRP